MSTLVDLFTVFAYFQIAGSIVLGFLCLLGWEITKKDFKKTYLGFPVPSPHSSLLLG